MKEKGKYYLHVSFVKKAKHILIRNIEKKKKYEMSTSLDNDPGQMAVHQKQWMTVQGIEIKILCKYGSL